MNSVPAFTWMASAVMAGFWGIALPASVVRSAPTAQFPTPPLESSSLVASSALEQGRSLYETGRFAEAAAIWQQTSQIYAAQGDRPNQILSLSYLSLAQQKLHQWEAAGTAIDQSLTLLRGGEPMSPILWAQVFNTQANLLLQTGQPQMALEHWRQAEQFYRQAGDAQGVLGSQINQAQTLQTLGFYQRSRQILEQINQQLSSRPDSDLKIRELYSLGNALRLLGDFPASQKSLEQGLAIAQNLGRTRDFSPILLSLGNVAANRRNSEAALYYFSQSAQTATHTSDRLEAQLNQLRLYAETGQLQPLQALAPKIQQELSNLPPSRISVYATVNLTHSLFMLDRRTQPLPAETLAPLLAKAVQSARSLNDPQAEAHALSQWGELYARQGQTLEAIRLLRQSLKTAQSIQAKDLVSQAAWKLGRLLHQYGQRQAAIAAYSEAIAALQSLRTDLVSINQDVQFSFRESVEPVYREMVGLLLIDNPDQTALVKVRELIEALQLAELDNFFRDACLNTQPRQIDQIDPKAAVVYSILLPDRLAVILSTAGHPLRYYATPIAQADAEKTMRELLALLHPASDNGDRLRLSRQIYDWLIHPAEADQTLKGKQTLVFVLDGLLRKIPMSALYDGNQYLIEKYAVALSPGLRLMGAEVLQQQRVRAVVGGISEARDRFPSLPNVKSEVNDISVSLHAAKLLNQEFTQKALAKDVQAKSANVIHLATHGQFSSNQEETYLLTWDGRLSIRELSEMLRNRETHQADALELLVLSACNTAAGDDRAVLGLAGLAIKSGARSTMASLWPVKDQVAARLMVQFYQALRNPKTTKAEALRQAQLSLLKDESYNDPFFWSSFVLVGNWL